MQTYFKNNVKRVYIQGDHRFWHILSICRAKGGCLPWFFDAFLLKLIVDWTRKLLIASIALYLSLFRSGFKFKVPSLNKPQRNIVKFAHLIHKIFTHWLLCAFVLFSLFGRRLTILSVSQSISQRQVRLHSGTLEMYTYYTKRTCARSRRNCELKKTPKHAHRQTNQHSTINTQSQREYTQSAIRCKHRPALRSQDTLTHKYLGQS